MHKIVLTLGLACGFLLLLTLVLHVQAVPMAPAGRHCGGAGPLPVNDPDYCGCTWGEVLFHGQPVPGATVTLAFGGGTTTTVTGFGPAEQWLYYDKTAYGLGARRGDVLTLTAHFCGQTIARSFRAWPDSDGEQHVALAFPEQGVWSPWVTGGYTRALALAGDVVWAGGPAGVISISMSTGVSVVHTLPWATPLVRALAVVTPGHIWAAGGSGVAEFDGSAWHSHTIPLPGTPRALVVDKATDAVWVGGGDDAQGSVAVYRAGTWQTAGTFPAPVTALAVDDDGRVWAGTWGEGVYRQDGSGGWSRMQCTLASNYVVAAVAGGGGVWFGTEPYATNGIPRGGIVRYYPATGTCQVYTVAHGLPAITLAEELEAPASVYALARGVDGTVWAGTAHGVWFPPCEGWWAGYTTTHGLRPGGVQALVVGSGTAVAATSLGLDRLDPAADSGLWPVAQITDVSPLVLARETTLTLRGGGWDRDEDGARIVAWDWSSSLDGSMCTSGTCVLSGTLFTSGTHTIALQVEDDEGMWSAPVTCPLMVEPRFVFLPLVLKQLAGDCLPVFNACPDIGQRGTCGSRAR